MLADLKAEHIVPHSLSCPFDFFTCSVKSSILSYSIFILILFFFPKFAVTSCVSKTHAFVPHLLSVLWWIVRSLL